MAQYRVTIDLEIENEKDWEQLNRTYFKEMEKLLDKTTLAKSAHMTRTVGFHKREAEIKSYDFIAEAPKLGVPPMTVQADDVFGAYKAVLAKLGITVRRKGSWK